MKNQKEIIQQIKSSDIQSFEKLFNTYYSFLCVFANQFVRDMQTAEEIIDDLFYHIWEIRKELEIRDDFKSYLLRSTYNRCISHLRKLKKEQKIIRDLAINAGEEILQIHTVTTPLHLLVSDELMTELNRTVEALPEQCKKIFLLKREEDLSYDEIAKRLKISKNTVKTQIKIALKKIREELNL